MLAPHRAEYDGDRCLVLLAPRLIGTLERNIGAGTYEPLQRAQMPESEGLTDNGEVDQLSGERELAARAAVLSTDSFSELEALLSRVPLGVAFLDEELRIDQANDGFARVMGIPRGNFVGRTIDAVLPFVADLLQPVLQRVRTTGEAVSELEFAGVAPNDGGTRHWLSAIVPVHRTGSRVTRIGFIVRDITERIAAREGTVRITHQRESIYGLATALVEAETPQDVVRATIQHTTAAFGAAGTVVARRSADGEHLEVLDAEGMPPDVADEWRRFPLSAPVPLAYVARTGESIFLESEADWKAHFPELAELAAGVGHAANAVVPLVIERRPVGALGIAFRTARRLDAEDRALAEILARQCALALERARLLAAERAARADADSANRMKTKFLATMSHECRTPLNAIAGYAELLDLGIHGPLTSEQRTDLSRIQHNVRHLLGLVGNVLSLLKLESGRSEYRITDVGLGAVLEFLDEATAPQIAARNLRYEQRCETELAVYADAEKLSQILLNLLSNAIKFTDVGGSITVRCSADDDRVRIEVRDTGRGIPADQLERVFDPFVRVDQTLNRPTEGTGLGLAISRELARAMNGDLTATSRLGEGSAFTLVLPRARESGASESK